jgi:hypothetical protein
MTMATNAFLEPSSNTAGAEVPQPAEPSPPVPAASSEPQERPDGVGTEYIIAVQSRPQRFAGEKYGAEMNMAFTTVFGDDERAWEKARTMLAIDHPVVVRVTPGFRIVDGAAEHRAVKALMAIRTIVTGQEKRFTREEEISELVEVIRHVVQAFRTRREDEIRALLLETIRKAPPSTLLTMADRLNLTPAAYAEDPFRVNHEPPKKA